MRTHGGDGSGAADARAVVRTEAEEEELKVVELLKQGLDFNDAMEVGRTCRALVWEWHI
jgi:hypothetical protein